MSLIIPLYQIRDEDREQVGGKAFSLAALARLGLRVPDAICIRAEAYEYYVAKTGLKERILLELNRKNLQEMRWEEMWDASLRIRNMFLHAPIPPELSASLRSAIEEKFKDKPVVVRSSAPGEDSSKASFAGLHESYVNVRGADAILDHLRLVWASLWSDGALLYRRELGLEVETSTMAVLVQEIAVGQRSGVVFGISPNDASQSVIEAVYGLNAGLVDGTVEPDRWILDRVTGTIISFAAAQREKWVRPSVEGFRLEPLPIELLNTPPLSDREAGKVFGISVKAEKQFKTPQDMEWTFRGNELYVLQSRPITTAPTATSDDKRPWYLSLRRSFENLKELRQKIEKELIPAMVEEADHLAREDLFSLSDALLADEIERRIHLHEEWAGVYWAEFIPFAHGMRLCGQLYNDTVRPSDPYEFMDLLGTGELASLKRNRLLQEMATMIRNDPSLAVRLRKDMSNEADGDEDFRRALAAFTGKYGDLFGSTQGGMRDARGREVIVRLLLEMAEHPYGKKGRNSRNMEVLTENFLSRCKETRRELAYELLDLARASYRLRDDDNIYLGRIEREMARAVEEGRYRVERRGWPKVDVADPPEVAKGLRNPDYRPRTRSSAGEAKTPYELKARQIVGQPAGPGIARGKARVIQSPSDLFEFKFKAGEILVCDAVDPNMTFVVPISSGIVERRGGMLIHGAIIAREYGLPCVTGVPDATSLIRTGDTITVDGYLGVVIIG